MTERYRVLSSYNLMQLEKKVNDSIEDGFELVGAVIVRGSAVRGEELFYQTMYKRRLFVPLKPGQLKPEHMPTTIDKPNREVVEPDKDTYKEPELGRLDIPKPKANPTPRPGDKRK